MEANSKTANSRQQTANSRQPNVVGEYRMKSRSMTKS
jgi:hypothetical protein